MLANKRGRDVALGGFFLQLVLAALAVALWWFTRAKAAWPALWLVVAPVPIWLLTLILFYCRQLERREAQELQELAARGGERASIFAAEGSEGEPVRVAASRLRWMERYLVAIFTLLMAGDRPARHTPARRRSRPLPGCSPPSAWRSCRCC
jgi:hypothetical protein